MYSLSTYPGNEYIEDRHEIREIVGGDVFCGVFDGHGGWQVAEYASVHLSKNLEMELSNMGHRSEPDQVSKALVRAFERTDRGVIHKVHHAFEIGLGNVAKVGACALTVLIKSHHVFVANAGDCRAVLGKRLSPTTVGGAKRTTKGAAAKAAAGAAAERQYKAVALSQDHNAKLPKEALALQQAHPGEADIVKCKHANACYVKGRLQPTRALGDAYLKYSEFNGRPNRSDSSAGRYISPPYTPPYITATPEVHVFEGVLDDPMAEFIIVATDGVWDLLTNEEAVRFVGQTIAKGDGMHVSQQLIAHALEARAKDLGMTVEELRALPPGKARRSKHDDMTALVIMLQGSAAGVEPESAAANPQEGKVDTSIDPTVPPGE
jgi:pyruvate dehydrogenase phosphatase|eukprot:evm.model.NODE_21757_length_20200_cov_26.998911.5